MFFKDQLLLYSVNIRNPTIIVLISSSGLDSIWGLTTTQQLTTPVEQQRTSYYLDLPTTWKARERDMLSFWLWLWLWLCTGVTGTDMPIGKQWKHNSKRNKNSNGRPKETETACLLSCITSRNAWALWSIWLTEPATKQGVHHFRLEFLFITS